MNFRIIVSSPNSRHEDALAQQGRVKAAVDHYSDAFRIAPECAKAHNNIASALASQGRLQAAAKRYLEAISSSA